MSLRATSGGGPGGLPVWSTNSEERTCMRVWGGVRNYDGWITKGLKLWSSCSPINMGPRNRTTLFARGMSPPPLSQRIAMQYARCCWWCTALCFLVAVEAASELICPSPNDYYAVGERTYTYLSCMIDQIDRCTPSTCCDTCNPARMF